jgi:hypothetical protein
MVKKLKTEVNPGLKQFFDSVILPWSGTCPTRLTRQQSGTFHEEDFEDLTKQDLEWTKRRLFGGYCFDLGYLVMKGTTIDKRQKLIFIKNISI